MKNKNQKAILIGIILIIAAMQAHAAYIGGYKEIRYAGDLLINATTK